MSAEKCTTAKEGERLFDVVLSRPSREYRTIEGVVAKTADEARRLALRASRLLDEKPEATFSDVGIEPRMCSNISEWGHYPDGKARQRIESVVLRSTSTE